MEEEQYYPYYSAYNPIPWGYIRARPHGGIFVDHANIGFTMEEIIH